MNKTIVLSFLSLIGFILVGCSGGETSDPFSSFPQKEFPDTLWYSGNLNGDVVIWPFSNTDVFPLGKKYLEDGSTLLLYEIPSKKGKALGKIVGEIVFENQRIDTLIFAQQRIGYHEFAEIHGSEVLISGMGGMDSESANYDRFRYSISKKGFQELN